MLKTWRVQRVHILRGCLSDPELSEGIMDRDGGTLQLNHVAGEGAKVPVWIPVRGPGHDGVVRWNFQRPVDMKKPGAVLPAVFDPANVGVELCFHGSDGTRQVPCVHLSDRDTGERFGLESREPGCRPLPLDWDKHKMQQRDPPSALVPPPAPDDAPGAHFLQLGKATAVPSLPLRHLSASISLLLDV
ncbi:hypothetical protein D4764_0100950 [Takifugu flavidus]|uniref:Uncharacterized protein n=1 Tax=Takifugu flavidus TaxID=433684 RepID=A0A5C6MIC6_9TELE|nr:hypothetical protein D4764_0100950 [Takifugu flavidus]